MICLIVDIAAAAIIIGFAVAGAVRGFVKTFFGLFGTILALVAALFLLSPLSSFLQEKWIGPGLSDFFLSRLTEETQQEADEIDFSALPESASALFDRFGVSKEGLNETLRNAGKNVGRELARTLAEKAVASAASFLSKAVAFLSVFLLATLLIWILATVLDLVAKVPGLKLPNRIFGLLAGLLEGAVLSYVFAVSMNLLAPVMRSSDQNWLSSFSVEKTFIVRFLSGLDPLQLFRL